MTPRRNKKSIAKKIAAGMIVAALSTRAFPLIRPNAGKQIAIRTGDYESVLNTLTISNNAKTNLRRAVNRLATINPVAAVGAEIAQISDPKLARQYADSLYRYADDIQSEFAINARNVITKAQEKLTNACKEPGLASLIIYGDCGDVQAKAVANFTKFKKQFVKKTRKETLSNIRNQIEFIALAPKVSSITNAQAEKIATRFLRERRITEDGRMTVYSEELRTYLGDAVRYYVKVLLALMAMASFISYKVAEIFKPAAIKEIMSKKPSTARITSVSPNKVTTPKKKTPPSASKKKTPPPPPPPPPSAPKKKTPPPAPKKKTPPSRNNMFAQIKSGSVLRKTPKMPPTPRGNTAGPSILSQIKSKPKLKTAQQMSPKKAPTSAVNPVLAAALAKIRASVSPSNFSPN